LPGSLARQPCPAALPGSLARSLARQPCPAALQNYKKLLIHSSAVGQHNYLLDFSVKSSNSKFNFYVVNWQITDNFN
jgi:hypothetical protein